MVLLIKTFAFEKSQLLSTSTVPGNRTYIRSRFCIAEASTTTHRVANALCCFSYLRFTMLTDLADSPVQSRIVDILTITLPHEPENLIESFRTVVCVNFAGILRVLWRCHRKNRYEPRSFISIQPPILATAGMKYLSPASLLTAESLPLRYWLSRRPKPSQVVLLTREHQLKLYKHKCANLHAP